MSAVQPLFSGEVQFRRYSDTSTQGQQVVFALSSREELQSFIGLEGKRFMAVLVQIGDDEQPVQVEPKTAGQAQNGRSAEKMQVEREPLGDLCWRAVQWCKDAEFQQFIRPIYDRHLGGNGDGWGDVLPKDFPDGRDGYTAHAIKMLCRVDSRKDLDSDPAKAVFLREIVGPWQRHCMARGIQ